MKLPSWLKFFRREPETINMNFHFSVNGKDIEDLFRERVIPEIIEAIKKNTPGIVSELKIGLESEKPVKDSES